MFFAADLKCASTFPRLRGVITTCAEQSSPSASWKRHERDAPSLTAQTNRKARDLTEPSAGDFQRDKLRPRL
jgi:hypothetical protein